MTTVEIMIIVFFAIVVLAIFFLFLINSLKIKKRQKKEKEQLELQKKEQEKQEKALKKANETNKKPEVEAQTLTPPATKDVIEVKSSNEIFEQSGETVALTDQPVDFPLTRAGSLENMSREDFEAHMKSMDSTDVSNKKQAKKSLKKQIDELSPELKSVLFTDILKTKF